MNDAHITVDGVPLEEVLAATERNIEVVRHLRDEMTALGLQCGLRRCSSKPSRHLSRPGRPKKPISLCLMAELEPYLRDESCPIAGIADLFCLTICKVRFYQRRLGIQRRRGRKSLRPERRTA